MTRDPLFRRQALETKLRRIDGDVVLETPLGTKLIAGGAMVLVLAGLSFAFFAEYARIETVSGWLSPEGGTTRIVASASGQISTLRVEQGQAVVAGEVLAVLRLDMDIEGGGVGSQILSSIRSRAEHEAVGADAEIARLDHSISRLQRSLSSLQDELDLTDAELDLQREQEALAIGQFERAQQLADQGIIPNSRLEDLQRLALQARQSRLSLARTQASLRRQIAESQSSLAAIPAQIQREQARASAARESLEERLLTTEAQTEVTIRTTVEGSVAAVPVSVGQSVSQGQTLAIVVPTGDRLIVELLVPTRAVGFVQPGQEIRIRFRAFPHQRFGISHATVVQVTHAILSPSDIPYSLVALAEPVFLVRAELSGESLRAYGENVQLQPGMLVDADIILDRRNLLEYLFDPIYAVTPS